MEGNVTRDSVLALILEKEKIETEISQMKSVLDSVSSVVTLFELHGVHTLNACAVSAAVCCIEVVCEMSWYPPPVVSRSVNPGIWWWLLFMRPNENVSTESA
jgi:hypothetical protein